jgi:hypothetical protein
MVGPAQRRRHVQSQEPGPVDVPVSSISLLMVGNQMMVYHEMVVYYEMRANFHILR